MSLRDGKWSLLKCIIKTFHNEFTNSVPKKAIELWSEAICTWCFIASIVISARLHSSIDIIPSQIFAVSSDNTFSVLKNSINSKPIGFVFLMYIYIYLLPESLSGRLILRDHWLLGPLYVFSFGLFFLNYKNTYCFSRHIHTSALCYV